MPNKEYEQYTKKISNYMIAIYQTNQHALNLDEDASLKDILDVNKDKNIANGREQAKIEKFLKRKISKPLHLINKNKQDFDGMKSCFYCVNNHF